MYSSQTVSHEKLRPSEVTGYKLFKIIFHLKKNSLAGRSTCYSGIFKKFLRKPTIQVIFEVRIKNIAEDLGLSIEIVVPETEHTPGVVVA